MVELLENEEIYSSIQSVKYAASSGTLHCTNLRFLLNELETDKVIISVNYDTVEKQLKNPDASKNILLKLQMKELATNASTVDNSSSVPPTNSITLVFRGKEAVKDREIAIKSFTQARNASNNKANSNGESRRKSNGEVAANGNGSGTNTTDPTNSTQNKNTLPTDLDVKNSKLKLNKRMVSETEAKIRGNILSRNPNLASLHNSLVINGTLSEEEFWENRQFLLRNQVLNDQQVKAQTSAWIDLKPSAQEGNEIRYTLTPEIIHDIFLQHPSVQKAYEDNVPDKISEASFWKRYFGSKYFHRNRSVGRVNVDTKDELFDNLMEIDDRQANQLVNQYDINKARLTLNLFASEEDHGETGNRPDITMRSGKRGDALSLIRRFNFHSEQVLKKSKPKVPHDEKKEFKEELQIEHLNPEPVPTFIPLDIHRKGLFSEPNDELKLQTEDRNVNIDTFFINYFKNTKVNLKAASNQTGGATDAMSTINQMVKTTNNLKRSATINDKDLKQTTLDIILDKYQSGNELLRHFWAAHLNPTTDPQHIQSLKDKKARMLEALLKLEAEIGSILEGLTKDSPEKNAVDKLLVSLFATLNQAKQTVG